MGARVKRIETLPELGLVRSIDDNATVPDTPAPQSIKCCSWDSYRDPYPYGVVIRPSEMAMVQGLANDWKAPAKRRKYSLAGTSLYG
jgi:putative alpha-1,2-mannosidase